MNLGIGPITGLRPQAALAPIPDRLIDSTVQASLGFVSRSGAAGSAREAVASLAERVLRTMLLAKLSLCFVPATAFATATVIVLGLSTLLAAGSPASDVSTPGPNDLSGRIVSEAHSGVADSQVWAVVGSWGERKTIATGKTDGEGRFVLSQAWEDQAAKRAIAAGEFGLVARAPDGRIGWLAKVDRTAAGTNNMIEITVGDVGEARGRVTDQNGRANRRAPESRRS